MPKKKRKDQAWYALEKIVAEIHRQLSPGAVVQHDVVLKGRSGADCQFDVLIEQSVGPHLTRIGIECKRELRPVDKGGVRRFVGDLRDADVWPGIMISASGFTKGARAVARDERIRLMSYREASDADWKLLLSGLGGEEASRLKITRIDLQGPRHFLVRRDDSIIVEVPPNTLLFKPNGERIGSIDSVREQLWKDAQHQSQLGQTEFKAEADICVQDAGTGSFVPVKELRFVGTTVATEYVVNAALAGGHVLENETKRLASIQTKGIDWGQVMKGPGRVLSADEFADFQAKKEAGMTVMLDPKSTHQYIRLEYTTQEDR
jgi:hypothetical protein